MKRARRRSESVPQSDVSFSDTEEYKPRAGQTLQSGERGSGDRNKTELRRLKNREAARRVRERRSNQLTSYKSQVDDLRKENQTLLQIIAQLQTASLDSISTGGAPLPAAAAGLGGITSGSTLVPLLGGGAGGEGEGPPGGTASCLSAGAPHDSIDSGPSGLRSGDQSAPNNTSLLRHADLSSPPAASAAAAAADAGLHQPQQQQQRRLLPTSSCPYWGAVGSLSGGGAGGTNAPDANVSGECVISQPVDTSAVFSSSTMQLLSGCHSAPHPHAALRQAQQVQLLQRACGCTGDEECEECEGVRVTLSSASNLPLVTTPGPRPKPLTLEDLHLTGLASRGASQGHTGSMVSAPLLSYNRAIHSSGSGLVCNRDDAAAAASARHSVDGGELLGGHRQQQQRLRQIAEQQQGAAADGMLVYFVGTLEPSSRVGGVAGGVGVVRPEGHSSSRHAVFGVGGDGRVVVWGSSFSEPCYLRKSSSNSRSTRQKSNPPAEIGLAAQPSAAAAAATAGGSVGGSGSLFNTLGSGSATMQQQQQWTAMGGGCSASQAASLQPDTAAAAGAGAADMCVDTAPQSGSLAGMDAAVVPPAAAGVVGSNTSMVGPAAASTHTGSFMAPPAAATAAAGMDGSSDSFLAAAAAAAGLGMCPSAADAAAAAAALSQQGAAGPGSKATTGKQKGKKLMRSIAAAVSGLVKSGRRSSGSSAGGRNTPRGALAALQQQLVGRSMSDATMMAAPPLATQSYGGLPSTAGTLASFTAGVGGSADRAMDSSAAAAAAQQQQLALLGAVGGAGYAGSMTQLLAAAQQQLTLDQLLLAGNFGSGSSSGAFGGSSSDMHMMMMQQQQAMEDDSIILAAQQTLQRQQQRPRGGSNVPAASAAAAAAGEVPSMVKQEGASPVPASKTVRQQKPASSPQLPPAQHQQQQVSLQGLLFGLDQPQQQQQLGVAGVLPLDFQATYTNSGMLPGGEQYCEAGAAGGDGDEDALADDVVMQLARQEGVLIDDPYCSLL